MLYVLYLYSTLLMISFHKVLKDLKESLLQSIKKSTYLKKETQADGSELGRQYRLAVERYKDDNKK